MKTLTTILLLCLFALCGFAQDAPKASDQPVKPAPSVEEKTPATAIIPAAAAKEITSLQKDAQIVALQINNLQLQIEKAKAELAKLQEAEKKAGEALNQAILAAAKVAGIASDKLIEYDVTTAPDGAWILKKKEKPAAPSGK